MTTTSPTSIGPAELVDLANRGLPAMQRPDGLFCFEVDHGAAGGPERRGESVRYSLMVLLGALRQRTATGRCDLDLEGLHRAVHRRRSTLGAGDLGLLLWADVRMDAPTLHVTAALLDRATADARALDRLPGMEIAWATLGAVEALGAGRATRMVIDRMLLALDRRETAGALFRHQGGRGARARFANFATEIYTLLALAELGRHGVVPGAVARARRLADRLVALRADDGGWPWLFDADRGTVVERYAVYSVHQDAMAPMALLALSEVCGEAGYRQAAIDGLAWLAGRNDLGVAMVDLGRGTVFRSIRRPYRSERLHLAVNAGSSFLGSARRLDVGRLEVNRTCRPYHLGWILEAWSGRSPLVEPAGQRVGEVGRVG